MGGKNGSTGRRVWVSKETECDLNTQGQDGYSAEVKHYCDKHSSVETGLRCSKCGRYICPRCMVQTSVGARCRGCAKIQRIPMYEVNLRQYVMAAAVASTVGVLAGVVWASVLQLSLGWIFFVPWLLAAGVGYVIGEAVSVVVSRRRGSGLMVVAALGVVIAFGVVVITIVGGTNRFNISVYNVGYALLFLLVAAWIAVSRVR